MFDYEDWDSSMPLDEWEDTHSDDTGDVGDVEHCPRCESNEVYLQITRPCRCWIDINDQNERGITIIVQEYMCIECSLTFEVQRGRPLNVECECD